MIVLLAFKENTWYSCECKHRQAREFISFLNFTKTICNFYYFFIRYFLVQVFRLRLPVTSSPLKVIDFSVHKDRENRPMSIILSFFLAHRHERPDLSVSGSILGNSALAASFSRVSWFRSYFRKSRAFKAIIILCLLASGKVDSNIPLTFLFSQCAFMFSTYLHHCGPLARFLSTFLANMAFNIVLWFSILTELFDSCIFLLFLRLGFCFLFKAVFFLSRNSCFRVHMLYF